MTITPRTKRATVSWRSTALASEVPSPSTLGIAVVGSGLVPMWSPLGRHLVGRIGTGHGRVGSLPTLGWRSWDRSRAHAALEVLFFFAHKRHGHGVLRERCRCHGRQLRVSQSRHEQADCEQGGYSHQPTPKQTY